MKNGSVILFDAAGRPLSSRNKTKALSLGGFNGARDQSLNNWNYLTQDIMNILKFDLRILRARSRDMARNDDSCRRFLHILKQNVLGHACIKLQVKNRKESGDLDEDFNRAVETEWIQFGKRRRRNRSFESPSACGQMTLREIAWLTLWNRAIDGEVFIQILPGYPHNRSRFAMRFLNPDMLDAAYTRKPTGKNNRIEMGIELDEFDRPVAYHFTEMQGTGRTKKTKRQAIPATQIIHVFRKEYIGQLRGIPDFAGIMKKAKMLNGIHDAIVVGWRIAASKMGFLTPDENYEGDEIDATDIPDEVLPGALDLLPKGVKFSEFDPDYPSSTYAEGYKTFMRQIANGLNLSSNTLSNDYSDVNYSSLRQALLEDREGWRCVQAEMIDDFYQPIFDEWYAWQLDITGRVAFPGSPRITDPVTVWQPRGWPWVDPLKEVNAQIAAINANLRTRQSIISETTGGDFIDTADELKEEKDALEARRLNPDTDTVAPAEEIKEKDDE
jgi:lambda family phage portal protein